LRAWTLRPDFDWENVQCDHVAILVRWRRHGRTNGVGFCYNLGRFVTAGGVFGVGYLVGLFGSHARAASSVSLVFVIGLGILAFARETHGESLK
jgi:MFS-type transporter involved in bile tolerance (Atg22 family)